MNKSIYKMEMHETLTLAGLDTSILRVPGGWIYTQHYPINRRGYNHHQTEYETVATFVPITKEGVEHE